MADKSSPASTYSQTTPGGLVRFRMRLADPTSWIGPTWAVLCSVAASNVFRWHVEDWVRLGLLILLAEGSWGTLWASIGSTDWFGPVHQWRSWRPDELAFAAPYTLRGAPGHRVSRWIGQLRSWWRDVLWPACGAAISSVIITVPVTAVLAALLGPESLLLSVAALAVMQLGVAWTGGRGVFSPGWDSILAIALPWLAGHAAFAPPTLHSVGMAVGFTLAWRGSGQRASGWGRAVGIASQLAVATSLVGLHQPLATLVLVLLVAPQAILLPWIDHDEMTRWYSRRARPWLMAAMLVAASAS